MTGKRKLPGAEDLPPLRTLQEEVDIAVKATAPYRILGWCKDRERIFYQHRTTGQIADIKPAAAAGPLLKLAKISWWEQCHPSRMGIDWAAACSDVIEQADGAGVFAVECVRGRGVWMEGDSVVWHLGNRLEVDGQEVPLIQHRSTYHYPRLPALDIDRTVAPLTDAEGRDIHSAVAAMGWASPLDPIHLLGWAVLANVGAALDKRPVLQITSRYGSGKSYTREQVLAPLLAVLAISTSNSTEAGIRQSLGADTLPVLIDESEGEDPRRREGHLRLARLSFDGTSTSRGTSGGHALAYAVRSSIAMVGINATIANPADRSRAVLVGREQLPSVQWAPVDQRLRQLLTPQTGARLLRRIVTNLPTLRANVATFRRAVESQLGSGAAARAGDTYGALLAGAHLLTSTTPLDDVQAISWLDSIGWSAATALGEDDAESQDGAAEGIQCLAHLLGHEETWRSDTGTGRLSIRELVVLARKPSAADDAEQARTALGRRGIRVTDMGLEVANDAEALAPIYGNTKWRDGGHKRRLRDLPGADAPGVAHFPVLGSKRCARVPWDAVA
jgi:putative DNA primase/helicase